MESRKDLLVVNVQAFNWASHLEHLDLKDDNVAWKDKREGESKETSKVTFQKLDPRTGHAIEQPMIQNLKG